MQKSAEPIEQIRTRICSQRRALSPQTAAAAASAACQSLAQLPEFSEARRIAAYLSVNGEIETRPLIETAWQRNLRVYMPILQPDGGLLFAIYTPGSRMRNNRFRIPEPEISPEHPPLSAGAMDLLIAPLVAFDPHCQRIGMGAGYYDRTLAACAADMPVRIGLAYEFQKVPAIQARDWDMPMHKIVTEHGVYIKPG